MHKILKSLSKCIIFTGVAALLTFGIISFSCSKTQVTGTADTVYAENFADYEDLSVAKIRARLSQGVKNEVLAKETIKVDGKAKVHYTRIAE